MSKALYFRVGMDTGVGGCVAPIFPDGTFEYIPIPDFITTEKYTYSTCKGIQGEYLSKYLPSHLHARHPHYDPDFRGEIPVYGDSTAHQKQVRMLREGDLLAFYAGLSPWKSWRVRGDIDLYFIGYLVVDEVVVTNIDNVLSQPPNAHTKRFEYVISLSNSIKEKYNMSLADLIAYYKDNKNREVEEILNDLNILRGVSRKGRVGHSSIKGFRKTLKTMLDKNSWHTFVSSYRKELVLATYMHILDTFSQFTLVKGKSESRILSKALKLSKRGINKAGSTENVVSDNWYKILGIPEGLSLQRKNPRFVPNPTYRNKGDYEALRTELLNAK
jgi:hypothetical protein